MFAVSAAWDRYLNLFRGRYQVTWWQHGVDHEGEDVQAVQETLTERSLIKDYQVVNTSSTDPIAYPHPEGIGHTDETEEQKYSDTF